MRKSLRLSEGKLSAKSQSFARLTFIEAAEKYLQSRKLELQASSLTKETQLLVKLREYFAPMRLNRISAEQVLAFRESRSATCGPALVNMEVGVLRRALKRAKLWHTMADDVRPLKEPETIGRALTPEQKAALLKTASLKPEWQTAYYSPDCPTNWDAWLRNTRAKMVRCRSARRYLDDPQEQNRSRSPHYSINTRCL